MKMFSDCSGECVDCTTYYAGGCLAGHGDDDFSPINEVHAIRIIEYKKKIKSEDLEWTVNALKVKFPNLKIEE